MNIKTIAAVAGAASAVGVYTASIIKTRRKTEELMLRGAVADYTEILPQLVDMNDLMIGYHPFSN